MNSVVRNGKAVMFELGIMCRAEHDLFQNVDKCWKITVHVIVCQMCPGLDYLSLKTC